MYKLAVLRELAKQYIPFLVVCGVILISSVLGFAFYKTYQAGYNSGVTDTTAAYQDAVLAQKAAADQLRIENQAKIDALQEQLIAAQKQAALDYQRGQADADLKYQNTISELLSTNGGLWVQIDAATRDNRKLNSALAESQSKYSSTRRAYAQLSTAHSELLLRVGKDGDDAIRQLKLCQTEYVNVVNHTNQLIDLINEYPEVRAKALKLKK